MVDLNSVRYHNANLKELGPGLVAIFGTLTVRSGKCLMAKKDNF